MNIHTLSSRTILACSLLLLLTILSPTHSDAGETKKLAIVATLFPQYDFAKHIGGDKATVTMLLPPGTDAHAFDPKPSDVISIAKSDVFAYTGAEMEPWAEDLLDALKGTGTTRVVNVSSGIELIKNAAAEHEDDHDGHDDHEEHAEDDHDRDDHAHDNDDHDDYAHDDDHDHARGDHDHAGHVHLLDPHIWLDPMLAVVMVDNLLAAMCDADPENTAYYTANANALKDDLRAIDTECRAMAAAAKRHTLVFGGKFAFAYFTKRYGLEHIGAYDSCGAGEEPSIRQIIDITEYVKNNHIPVIYHEEFAEPRISKGIADATGCAIALAHSLHNLSAEERASGVAFVELMRRNVAAFAEGLR